MKILDKISDYYQQKQPFVAYRKPNDNILSSFFMTDDVVFYADDFSESGFVFAPYLSTGKAILFPEEKASFHSEILEDSLFDFRERTFESVEGDKKIHLNLVEDAISEICNTDLKKVVVSRKEDLEIVDFDVLITFQKILKKYQNAFVYIWYHPKVGLWMGATPETLVRITQSSFKTMSLAGTQLYVKDKKVVWKAKELEEQKLVTDFIESQLKEISQDVKVSETETVRAGDLLHLRTAFAGNLAKKSNLKQLIRALHPTPAVCGFPRNVAQQFILQNENYQRSFYTGFLGELNLEQKTQSALYVNLRCMSIAKNIVSIYVGGGITKDSIPQKEWQETVFKSQTIKSVLS